MRISSVPYVLNLIIIYILIIIKLFVSKEIARVNYMKTKARDSAFTFKFKIRKTTFRIFKFS